MTMEWQEMKNAPKDGRRLLVSVHAIGAPKTDNFVRMAYFNTDQWYFEDSGHSVEKYGYKMTHWMPLPAAPRPASKE